MVTVWTAYLILSVPKIGEGRRQIQMDGARLSLGTFRSEDDYEYEVSVLSMRTSKNVGLQNLMRMLSSENSYS